MRAFAFAARSLVRQPARSVLGILGVAAVGALLFDMLLLSHGLVVSFQDLLDRVGFDVRVMATDASALGGPLLPRATEIATTLRALPDVAEAAPIRIVDAEAAGTPRPSTFTLIAMDPPRRGQWTVVSGSDLDGRTSMPPAVLLNRRLADTLGKKPGDTVSIRVVCEGTRTVMPFTPYVVAGIADFAFDSEGQLSGAVSRADLPSGCDADRDAADMVLVVSREGRGSDAAVAAIRAARPDLFATTNEQVVARMQDTNFTYFRQISTVLSTITLVFGFLLITVLLTVSVNQRLAEIAAIRALGFSRARVSADVLWQSVLLVGFGGALALPLGLALSVWLDRILKSMPGIPAALHFFVFEPRALVLHTTLLAATSLLAAVYPMWLVARLPIAATLRDEVVS